MTRPEVAVLVNAAAGRGRAARSTAAVIAALTDGGVRPRVLAAATRTAAEQQAAAAVADGVAAVAALGGDGAAHAALQAVVGTATPLALLPAGSGNDLATALGVPADPVQAAHALTADLHAGRSRQIDAARTGERWWGTVLCCGFDSAVTDRANRLRWPRGPRRYDLAILLELAQLRPRAVTLTVDGAVREREVTLVAVGNTSWYGGGLKIAPGADPADGLLEVVVIGPVSRRELVRTRPRLADGSHVGHPAVTVLRGREVGLAGAGLTTWADGEPIGALPATTVCVPGAVTVLGTAPRHHNGHVGGGGGRAVARGKSA
ncbi:diacylglycerol kinase family protein [Modestobacter sp. VKM Ac-2983]|uniref:diacylglycerol/lipid kinase family protein n=1 Tax=Modestobacter sp. VKM Ac-2983 TaxID=3004137 RepID=UPI0022AB7A7E|nr:diacylglycerol kinase family protein [Modestobacter sp. VKM Ac-2983]MCZ2805656.1 diacylglycerol kinase family protein [Modestobacter sp. VKM Ac-2983]